ncbi:MAG: zinc ribbon domain-containing protein [Anaerolineae bacterium]
MTILIGIVALALVALTVVWIVVPLVRGTEARPERSPEVRALAELAAQHDVVLRSLRDLDADYAANKLDEADYQQQRALFLADGVAVLKRMDALKARTQAQDPALDAAIEAAVAERRRKLEAQEAGVVCPSCGSVTRQNARFCDQCGAPLQTTPLTSASPQS